MNLKNVLFTLAFGIFAANSAIAAASTVFSESAFNSALKSNEAFVVAFHSDSCGSCKVQKPNLEAALQEESLKATSGFMANFEATAEFRKKLDKPVRGPSTILVFKNGKEVGRILGETNKDKIRESILKSIAIN